MVQNFDYTSMDLAHHLVVDGPIVGLPSLLGHFVELEFRKGLMPTLRYDNFVSFAILELYSSFVTMLVSS